VQVPGPNLCSFQPPTPLTLLFEAPSSFVPGAKLDCKDEEKFVEADKTKDRQNVGLARKGKENAVDRGY
jgi:hypothetical protein